LIEWRAEGFQIFPACSRLRWESFLDFSRIQKGKPFSAVAIGGMAASAAGGILGAGGSMYSGEAQAAQATYQAGVARVNARIAQQDADYARAAGEEEAQQVVPEAVGSILHSVTAT
jgi:hypothetical protein